MSVATGSREARVHTQPSNRANAALSKGKVKESDERRVVYKPVLENPYQVKWPSTPLNVQNSILACLADLLPEVAEYHLARQTASRKRKTEKHQAKTQKSKTPQQPKNSKKRSREDDDTSDSKRAKISHDSTLDEAPGSDLPSSGSKRNSNSSTSKPRDSSGSTKRAKKSTKSQNATGNDRTNAEHEPAVESIPQTPSTLATIPVPPLLKHCTFGINEVTKRLEALAKPTPTDEGHQAPRPRLKAVLVCRSDVDPPLLIAHFPILVATCNSSLPADSSDDKFVKLVALPMRAEHSLAEVTGLRRVAAMAFDAETPGLERLGSLLSSVPVLRETWLAPPSSIIQEPKVLVPTHVKQLKTTAPKDMKVAKEKRKRELGEARERAKEDEPRGKKKRKLAPDAKADAVSTQRHDS